MVERIQLAVNSYYGQFEEAVEPSEEVAAVEAGRIRDDDSHRSRRHRSSDRRRRKTNLLG